jgi:multicomponent Na+:H+ antiporter subunit G
MMAWNFILGNLIVSAGAFFLLVGSVGLVRLPDFYSRAHATGKSDTLGVILTTLGLVVHEGFTLNSLKLGLLLVFIGLTSPTGTHALTRAALRSGLKPWFKKDAPGPQACPTEADHLPAEELLEPKEDD